MAVATVMLQFEQKGGEWIVKSIKGLKDTGKAADEAKKSLQDMFRGDASSAMDALSGKTGKLGQYLSALGPMGLAAGAGIGALALGLGAAAAAGAGLISWAADATRHLIDVGGSLADLAAKTGVGVEALQALGFAGSLVGVSMEEIGGSVSKMQKAIADGDASFKQLGLSIEHLRSIGPEQQFAEIAAKIAAIKDPTQQAAAAMDVFGKSGTQLLPLIKSDMAAAADEARRLGIILSSETVAAADALGDQVDVAAKAWEAFENQAAAALVETGLLQDAVALATDVFGTMTTVVKENKGAFRELADEARQLPGIMKAVADASSAVTGIDLAGWIRGGIGAFASSIPALQTFAGILDTISAKFQKAKETAASKGVAALAGAESPFSQWIATPSPLQGAPGVGVLKPGTTYDSQTAIKARTAAEKAAAQEMEKLRAEGMKAWEAGLKQQVVLINARYEEEKRLLLEVQGIAEQSLAAEFKRQDAAFAASRIEVSAFDAKVAMARQEILDKKTLLAEQLKINEALFKTGALSKSEFAEAQAGIKEQLSGTKEVVKATFDWEQAIGQVADAFAMLGFGADSTIGRIIGGMGAAAQAGKQFKNAIDSWKTAKSGSDKVGAGVQAAGAAFGVAGDIYNSAKDERSEGKRIGIGAGKGAAFGMQVGGPYGALIGAIVGGVIGGLSKAKWQGAAETAENVFAKQFAGGKISQALSEDILKTAKKIGPQVNQIFGDTDKSGLGTAALLHIADVMVESGKPAREFAEQVDQLIRIASEGGPIAAQAITALGPAFSQIAEESLAAGEVGADALVRLIDSARKLGVEVPEIKAHVEQQLAQATAGIGAGIGGIKLVTPEDAKSQATIAGVTFWAVFKEEGLLAAGDAFGEISANLLESIEKVGGDTSAAKAILGPIQAIVDLSANDLFRGAAEGAQGFADTLSGLANSAIPLTTGQFGAFGQQAQAAFAQAKEGGASSEQALLAIAPLLQTLQKASAAYGIELDANTQGLIDQGKAAGIAFPTEPMDRVVTVLEAIARALGAELPVAAAAGAGAIGAAGDAMSEALSATGEAGSAAIQGMLSDWQSAAAGGISVPVSFEPGAIPGVPGLESPAPESFAGGSGGFQDFGAGTPAVLHGVEAVIPWSDFASGGVAGGKGGDTAIEMHLNFAPVVNGAGNQEEILAIMKDAWVNNFDGMVTDAVEAIQGQL